MCFLSLYLKVSVCEFGLEYFTLVIVAEVQDT